MYSAIQSVVHLKYSFSSYFRIQIQFYSNITYNNIKFYFILFSYDQIPHFIFKNNTDLQNDYK